MTQTECIFVLDGFSISLRLEDWNTENLQLPSQQSSMAYIVMDVPNTVYVDLNVLIHDNVRARWLRSDRLLPLIKTYVHYPSPLATSPPLPNTQTQTQFTMTAVHQPRESLSDICNSLLRILTTTTNSFLQRWRLSFLQSRHFRWSPLGLELVCNQLSLCNKGAGWGVNKKSWAITSKECSYS
jgi:hypothetical protein